MTNTASNDPSKGVEEAKDGFKRFAEIATETLRKDYHSPLESFDMFAGRTEAQIVDHLKTNGDRLVHGYEVLLKELSKEK